MSAAAALQIVIRADASHDIGTGHVMRCLTLAKVLREQGAKVRFVSRAHEGNLIALTEAAGFAVVSLPQDHVPRHAGDDEPAHAHWLGTSWEHDAEQTLDAIADTIPDWLIVDHYGLDARWQGRLRARAGKILVIDDLADRPHDCDVLLDQNFSNDGGRSYLGSVGERATLLIGPTFALLGPDYATLRRRTSPRSGVPQRVLVSFGGADRLGLTRRTVEALLRFPQLSADVVLSRTSRDYDAIESRLVGQNAIRVLDRVPSLAPFMLAADIAIGAGGATHWERMCLGLPALVITMAENQREIARQLAKHGLIQWLGDADAVDVDDMREAIEALLREGVDVGWSRRCMALTDGEGASRVAAVMAARKDMPLVVRHGELRDEDILLEWANDKTTRANGYNPEPIVHADHVRWYRNKLRDPMACRFFIVETVFGVPVGQVRFDKRGEEWEISYAVAPPFRGRGVGRSMLEAALRELDLGLDTIIGQVKPENLASRRIFEAMGFTLRSNDPDRLVFEHHPQN